MRLIFAAYEQLYYGIYVKKKKYLHIFSEKVGRYITNKIIKIDLLNSISRAAFRMRKKYSLWADFANH